MWKSSKSRAEQHFGGSQKKEDALIKQKEKAQRERDERMARLRNLRLAKEAAEKGTETAAPTAELDAVAEDAAQSPGETLSEFPKVHPHCS